LFALARRSACVHEMPVFKLGGIMKRIGYLVAALWALASGTAAPAQVILSNYPPTNDTNTTAIVNNLRWKALSFSVPAGPDLPIGDLTVRLGNYDTIADAPLFQIRDHTGSITMPGTMILATFNAPAPNGTANQDYTFTPSSPFSLVGGTSYWIVLTGVAGGNFDWRGSSPAITPTGLATYGGQSLFTANGGTTWTTSATINSLHWVVAPEPTSVILTGLGAGAFWRLRRRSEVNRMT